MSQYRKRGRNSESPENPENPENPVNPVNSRTFLTKPVNCIDINDEKYYDYLEKINWKFLEQAS